MVRYLSPAWLAAADEAARQLTVPPDADLVVEHHVTGDPDGEVVYHVRVAEGEVRFVVGPAPASPVRFTVDVATATAIATGRLSAQRAFMDGHLRVGGDTATLLRHREVLDGLDDVLAELRELTEFPDLPPAGAAI